MIQAFHHIFACAAESRDLKYEVAISYQQIYLDTITDLLNPGNNVDLREDPKSGVYVDGAKVRVLLSECSSRARGALAKPASSSLTWQATYVCVSARLRRVLHICVWCFCAIAVGNGG